MAEHPRQRKAAGRKFGPLHGETEEFNALARFLRQRVGQANLTLENLEAATGLRKSAISKRLSGIDLDGPFVAAVVAACTTDGRAALRERYLAQGEELLSTAKKKRTAVIALDSRPPAVRDLVVNSLQKVMDAQERLLEAREQLTIKQDQLAQAVQARLQAEQALQAANSLSSVLGTWIVVLADQVEYLAQQRVEVAAVRPPDPNRLGQVEADLARVLTRHERTAQDLRRVESDRSLAAGVLGRLIVRSRQLQRDVEQLRRLVDSDQGGAVPKPAALERLDTPSLFTADIDFALDRAEEVSRAISMQLQGALADLGELPADSRGPLSVADNALTSDGTTDNALWWDMLAQVPAESLQWAEAEASLLLRTRDRTDSRLADLVHRHPTREIMLLADTLDRFLWSEGAARLRHALARSLPVEELVALAGALMEPSLGNRRSDHGAQLFIAAAMQWAPPTVARLVSLQLDRRAQEQPLGDPVLKRMARTLNAAAWRSLEDVCSIIREVMRVNPRIVSASPFLTGVLDRPSDEVLELLGMIEQASLEENEAFSWPILLHSLPQRERLFENTELLLRLWAMEGLPVYERGLLLDSCLPESPHGLAASILKLRQSWNPPLDHAAEQMLGKLIPVIIDISTIADLRDIGVLIANKGLDPDEVFGPYQHRLTVTFDGPGNTAGRAAISWY